MGPFHRLPGAMSNEIGSPRKDAVRPQLSRALSGRLYCMPCAKIDDVRMTNRVGSRSARCTRRKSWLIRAFHLAPDHLTSDHRKWNLSALEYSPDFSNATLWASCRGFRPFANNGRTFCGSVSGQLGDDRSERISGVGADDKVGEAALLASSQDFLDGRRRVTWKCQ